RVIVAHFSVRSPNFQFTHEVQVVFHKILFADAPSAGKRGEESKTFSFGEAGRSIITEFKGEHVFSGIVIIYLTHQRFAGPVTNATALRPLIGVTPLKQVFRIDVYLTESTEAIPVAIGFFVKQEVVKIVQAKSLIIEQTQLHVSTVIE